MAEEIVEDFFRRAERERTLRYYIERLCKKYGIRYRFLEERKYDSPIVTEIKRKAVVIFLPDLIASLDKLQKELYGITEERKKEILEELIKHEYVHIRVINELESKGISIEEQRRPEFVVFSEFYVGKIQPDPEEFRRMAYDKLMDEAITKEGRYKMVKKVLKEPLYTAGNITFLSEEDIKGIFKLEHPIVCDFLLQLKKLWATTNSVDDIVKNAKLLRLLAGFTK